jgi:flagellar motor switch protein FliG
MSASNLRKAAVLIRSLDSDTAATMLQRLSPDEAAAVRAAIGSITQIDSDEEADVVAEFRSARAIATESPVKGVELDISSLQEQAGPSTAIEFQPTPSSTRRFEFLEQAPIDALVPYLSREHVQTIAVVLSHLAPARAAAVLAGLSKRLRTETVERLATLGEMDPESVIVLETELAAWLAARAEGQPRNLHRDATVSSILSAADAATRNEIIADLRERKAPLADQLAQMTPRHDVRREQPAMYSGQAAAFLKSIAGADSGISLLRARQRVEAHERVEARHSAEPRLHFDDLIQLDSRMLAALVREVDINVLGLALAGSSDELIDRVCNQCPKRTSRTLRRQLRQLGPTRLSDVEAAQKEVARIASTHLTVCP